MSNQAYGFSIDTRESTSYVLDVDWLVTHAGNAPIVWMMLKGCYIDRVRIQDLHQV